ncbi:LpxD N-terminal domain-containing protein, partial [Lysobacter sp. 2RAB21]
MAERFSLGLHGDADVRVSGVGTLAKAGPGQLAFLANPKYRAQLAESHAGVVVMREDDAAAHAGTALIARDPYSAFAKMSALFEPKPVREPGIHALAVVDPSAQVSADAHVGPFVSIGARSRVEA